MSSRVLLRFLSVALGALLSMTHSSALAKSGPEAAVLFSVGDATKIKVEGNSLDAEFHDDFDQYNLELNVSTKVNIGIEKCFVNTSVEERRELSDNVFFVTRRIKYDFSQSRNDEIVVTKLSNPFEDRYKYSRYFVEFPKGSRIDRISLMLINDYRDGRPNTTLHLQGEQVESKQSIDHPSVRVLFDRNASESDVRERIVAAWSWYRQNICSGGF